MKPVIRAAVTCFLVIFTLMFALPLSLSAQGEGASTPVADEGPDETIWFLIAPEGKANGDFFSAEIEAGGQATLRGQFGNGSEIPVEAVIYAADVVSPVNGGLSINDSTFPVTAPTTWLDFPFEVVPFEAREIQERSFTVSVPEGTPPGQYITGVAIETKDAAPPPGELPILVKYRFVAAILITVPGPVTPAFEITDFDVSVDEASTLISGSIRNGGNIRVRPEGPITLTNAEGVEVTTAQLAMQSVYAGHEVRFEISLPVAIPAGPYVASIELADPDTGASASLVDVAIDVVAVGPPSPVTLTNIVIEPKPTADNVVFAQVAVTVSNTGAPMSGIRVQLTVKRDGIEVDSIDLASSVTVANGDTVIDQPYIPASGDWESGEYTFTITLSTVDPQTGTETVLSTVTPDGSFEIP